MADLGKTPRCLITIFLAFIPLPDSMSVALCPLLKVLSLKPLAILYDHSSYLEPNLSSKRKRGRGNTEGEGTLVST